MGKSSRESELRSSEVSQTPVIAVVPKPERCVSTLIANPLPITPVVSPSVKIEGDHPEDVARTTEACKSRSIGEAVTADISIPMSGDLSSGALVRSMGPRTDDSSHHQT